MNSDKDERESSLRKDAGQTKSLLIAAVIILCLCAAMAGSLFLASRAGLLPADGSAGGSEAVTDPAESTAALPDISGLNVGTPVEPIGGPAYVWCKEWTGPFVIILGDDGRFFQSSGLAASNLEWGTWKREEGIVTLTGKEFTNKKGVKRHRVYRFAEEDDGTLTFISEGSDKFGYVSVEDGDIFFPRDNNYYPLLLLSDSSGNTDALREQSADEFRSVIEKNGGRYTGEDGKTEKLEKTSGIKIGDDGIDFTIRDCTPEIEESSTDFRLISSYTGDNTIRLFYLKDGEIRSLIGEVVLIEYVALWDYDRNGRKDLLVSYLDQHQLSVAVVDLSDFAFLTVLQNGILHGDSVESAHPTVFRGDLFIDGEKVTWNGESFEGVPAKYR